MKLKHFFKPCRISVIRALFFVTLFVLTQGALATTIRILPTQHELSFGSTNQNRQAIRRIVASQLNPNQYREVRAQLIRDRAGNPHHILVYLSRIGYHQMKVVSLFLDPQFRLLGSNPNYKLQFGDIAQQPGRGMEAPAVCPDPSIQFVSLNSSFRCWRIHTVTIHNEIKKEGTKE